MDFFVIFAIFVGVCSAATNIGTNEVNIYDAASDKEIVRYELKKGLNGLCSNVQTCCSRELTPEQVANGNKIVNNFAECLNSTVDSFLDKTDGNIVRADFENFDNIGKYVAPLCETFEKGFGCVRDFFPIVQMCISPRELRYMNKIIAIVPLAQQTLCLNNGGQVASILEHADGKRCLGVIAKWIGRSGVSELLFSNSTELFGSESDCRQMQTLRGELNNQFGECSQTVYSLVFEMSTFFCEGTLCKQFISDLQCN